MAWVHIQILAPTKWVTLGLLFNLCKHKFLFIDHWGRLSCLSLLFFETLQSNGYIFPFLLCLLLLFFTQVFIRPPQTTILPFYISFSRGWCWSLPPGGISPGSVYFADGYQTWAASMDVTEYLRDASRKWLKGGVRSLRLGGSFKFIHSGFLYDG